MSIWFGMSENDEDVCPLCCEELDLSDKNFLPCPCGYRVNSIQIKYTFLLNII